jgi:hypothetical protein
MPARLIALFVLSIGVAGFPPSSSAPAAQEAPPLQNAPVQDAPVVPRVEAPAESGAKIWIGREHEFEEFLATAAIARVADVPVGVTRPRRAFFAEGGLAASAVFKALPPSRQSGFFESYKAEIAAYELDKLLGLGMVPPTIERRVKNDLGSLQLWVEGVKWLKERDTSTVPSIDAWNRQVYRHRVWDNLIANIDRNAGNLLVDDSWNLILIDHSRAFTRSTSMPFKMTRIDRPFYEQLKALTEADLAPMGKWLTDGPRPLLRRRDTIVTHFEKLIAGSSEAAVLVP